MTSLVVPPKLFIDTGHLINIHRVRSGKRVHAGHKDAYLVLDDCIRKRHFGVILSVAAPLDWIDGNATEESASQIAAVLDSAKLLYLVEPDTFVYLSEILRECARIDPRLNIPSLPILHEQKPGGSFEPVLGWLAHNVPDYIKRHELPSYLDNCDSVPTIVPVSSARRYALESARYRKENPDTFRERVDGYNAALQQDISHADLLTKGVQPFLVDWMKRYLRVDRVLTALNPGIDVDALLERLQLDCCPAVKLWFAAREKRIRAGHPPKENEVDDWAIIAVVPYADLVFIDSGLAEFLFQADGNLQAKVASDPNRARKILAKWLD